MYREPEAPTPPDPHLVVPDRGIGDLWIGRATPDDVLRVLGRDCKINRHGERDIYGLDFDYESQRKYTPSRPAQGTRPHQFVFHYGLCSAIRVGVYQKGLRTTGGVRIGSSRADVVATFGEIYDEFLDDDFVRLRYRAVGIELALGRSDGAVSYFDVFRATR